MTDPRSRTRVCFVSLAAYAYFADQASITPGGAERQLSMLGRSLDGRFDVHFVVGDYGQPAVEYRDGVTLHAAYTPSPSAPLGRRLRQMARLFDTMRRVDADVYVFRGGRTKAIITYVFTRLLGAGWVYNVSVDSLVEATEPWYSDPKDAVFGRILSDADGVIAQSPLQRRRLAENFGVESTVVPNGYPVDDAATDGDGEFFLFVGRIDRVQKRPHRFLELARRLPDEQFHLIGSRDEDDEYYREIAAEARALPNVEFHGRVDPGDVHEYYERAIALVNTSTGEGFPNTFLEAWRTGTPVVGLDVDPGRFLGEPGAGYAGGDFDELVVAVERLATDPAHRESRGSAVRERFEERFSIGRVTEEYAAVLRDSVAADPSEAG